MILLCYDMQKEAEKAELVQHKEVRHLVTDFSCLTEDTMKDELDYFWKCTVKGKEEIYTVKIERNILLNKYFFFIDMEIRPLNKLFIKAGKLLPLKMTSDI